MHNEWGETKGHCPFPKPKPKSYPHSDSRTDSVLESWKSQNVPKRPADTTVCPKVLWAKCLLGELLICFWRWLCMIVTLPTSHVAQLNVLEAGWTIQGALLLRKGKKRKWEWPRTHISLETDVHLPGCLQLRNIPFDFSKHGFVTRGSLVNKAVLGTWEKINTEKNYGCKPQICGLQK